LIKLNIKYTSKLNLKSKYKINNSIMNEYLSPGTYYLGDPCNVLHDKIFIGIYGNIYNYENGKFNINGTDFVVHQTHNGDGVFKDTKNRNYCIYSGFLALTNIKLIENQELCKKNGHVFDFKNKVNFIYDAGLFYIKSGKKYINIDTINHEEYNSDFEEHCENEEGEYISKTLLGDSDNDSVTSLFDNKEDDDDENEEETKEIKENSKSFQFFKK
jgi:hypothetical protein